MKRVFCLLLALILLFSLGAEVFAEDVLYCRICGRQIPVDSNVCPYCATAVVHADGSVASTPKTDTPAGPFKSSVRSIGNLRVTKSPYTESVPYGGSCIFIAHADNASSVKWYIANADATVIAEASEAPAYNSGLSVSGDKTDTLSLSGIPSWMNGYQVQACFTGSDGTVYTEVARIWTYEQPAPKKYWWQDWTYEQIIAFCYANPWAWDFFFPGMVVHGPDVDNAVVVDPSTGLSVAPEDSGIGTGPNAIAIHVGHEVNDPGETPAGLQSTASAGPSAAPEGFNPGASAGPSAAPANFNPGGEEQVKNFQLAPELLNENEEPEGE